MAKGNEYLTVRVTKNEWDIIHKRMEQCGFRNMSAYIRKMALNGFIIKTDLSDVREALRLVHIAGNNLNQYAKKANETGSIYKADIADLQERFEVITVALGEILERLSSI